MDLDQRRRRYRLCGAAAVRQRRKQDRLRVAAGRSREIEPPELTSQIPNIDRIGRVIAIVA